MCKYMCKYICMEFINPILYFLNLKKIVLICDKCKKNMENESSYIMQITDKVPIVICEKCIEEEYFY